MLLTIVIIHIRGYHETIHECRALLDYNLTSQQKNLNKLLNLEQETMIMGINNMGTINADQRINAMIESQVNSFQFPLLVIN